MGWEQRNADFCKAQTDAQMAYIEAEREVDQLQAENARLRELCADLYAEMITYSNAPNYNASVWAPKLRELGVEVDHGTR